MAELDRALRECIRLNEDAESIAEDVISVRQSIGELDDPWESRSIRAFSSTGNVMAE